MSWHKQRGRWQAEARLNGKSYFLGRFDVEEDAAAAASEFRARFMPWSSDAADAGTS